MNAKDIRKTLLKAIPHLLDAKSRKLNEADTSQRIYEVFTDVLGYDRHRDISKEVFLKSKKADIVLKVQETQRVVVEVKAATEPLKMSHIDQAKAYGSVNGIEWVLLTNGVLWTMYHISWSKSGIEETQVFHLDLADTNGLDDACESLALLHHESIKADQLDYFWAKTKALDPRSLYRSVFTEEVMLAIRKELRKEHGFLLEPEQIAKQIWKSVDKDVRSALGKYNIKKRKKVVSRDGASIEMVGEAETPLRNTVSPTDVAAQLTEPRAISVADAK